MAGLCEQRFCYDACGDIELFCVGQAIKINLTVNLPISDRAGENT